MIEFKGMITGKALKYLKDELRSGMIVGVTIALLVILPSIIYFYILSSYIQIIIGYLFLAVMGYVITFVPQTKKFYASITPKRIFTDEEFIVVVSGNDVSQHRLISDAKKLIDHGEFYTIKFPFGKNLSLFICQKELLSQGTLEEFEALFEGKIERKKSKKK